MENSDINYQNVEPMEPIKVKNNKPFLLIIILLIGFAVLLGAVFYFYFYSGSKSNSSTSLSKTSTVVETKEDPNTIVVWSWDIAARSLQSLIPEFNKVYPDIKVKINEIPHDEANSRFKTAMTTGVGFPDIIGTEDPEVSGYIDNGLILDITDLAAPYKNDFVTYKWQGVTKNGRTYALPWDSAPVGTFYRRDIFAAAGVKPEDIKTWDDFIAAGKKVTKAPNQYMTLMSKKADVSDFFQTLLNQFGGSEFDVNGNVVFNSPQGVQSVNLMKKILDSGVAADIGWWTPEFYAGIKSGQIATLTTGVWMGGQIETTAPEQSGKWGVMPIPATEINGVRAAVRGGSNLAVTAKSTKTDMAWKFIEYALARKESQLLMYKGFNIFPALKSTYTDPSFSLPNIYFGGQNTSQLFIESQNKISTAYYGPLPLETNQIISSEVVSAINGQKTAQQALVDSEHQVNKILGR